MYVSVTFSGKRDSGGTSAGSSGVPAARVSRVYSPPPSVDEHCAFAPHEDGRTNAVSIITLRSCPSRGRQHLRHRRFHGWNQACAALLVHREDDAGACVFHDITLFRLPEERPGIAPRMCGSSGSVGTGVRDPISIATGAPLEAVSIRGRPEVSVAPL